MRWGFHRISEGTIHELDDQLAAEGKGVTPLPVEVARLVVGSAADGGNPAQGEVDELFFFGRLWTLTRFGSITGARGKRRSSGRSAPAKKSARSRRFWRSRASYWPSSQAP